uniref:Uncharacterized protein n=1 Tax=Tanacetum cinerariifolium TaxID=118510 RepID=A0A699IWY8_TANCI|nr:hypothetical protein [Tanacetum cinerariifolium]
MILRILLNPSQYQTRSFESYNDNPNYGYPPQEPFVYNQDSCYEQNFVDNSQNPPQPQYETNSCELCGNNAYYGYDFPPQVLFVNNQDSCFNQDFDNNFTQTSPSFPQQYLCCEDCGGPHATFQCQPMNQNFYNSNSFSFDQIQPPQYPVIHHPPQEINDIHELLRKLLEDLQIINEELAEYTNSLSWNRYAFYDDDDDEYSIQVSDFLKKFPIPIAFVLPTEDLKNSLSMGDEHPDTIPEMESDEIIKSSVVDLVPIPSKSEGILDNMCDVPFAKYWKLPICYDDDDDEERSDSLNDNIISGLPPFSAITPDEPVLSTEEPDNSLSMGDEHLDTIPATESDEFIKSGVEDLIPIPSESEGILEHMCDVPFHDNSSPLDVSKDQIEDFSESNEEFSSIDDDSFSSDNIDYVEALPPDYELVSSEVMEIVIPEVGGIDDDILLTIKNDILREKFLNVNLLLAKIEALTANPTLSSDCKTKSSSASLNSFLEETNNFDNSLPEFETFCFDVEEISSGSTTTPPDISLSEYEVFHNDHVKEISSGSPTTHSDSSLYASSIFDLSINSFPPADRSDFYEFTNELIPFISAPEYDCFLFKVEPNSKDFTKDVVEDISLTKEPQVLNTLPTHPTLQLNMKFQPSSESLFTYVVWIFLPFLVYSVAPHYLLSLRNEDTIFDPGICNSTFLGRIYLIGVELSRYLILIVVT